MLTRIDANIKNLLTRQIQEENKLALQLESPTDEGAKQWYFRLLKIRIDALNKAHSFEILEGFIHLWDDKSLEECIPITVW